VLLTNFVKEVSILPPSLLQCGVGVERLFSSTYVFYKINKCGKKLVFLSKKSLEDSPLKSVHSIILIIAQFVVKRQGDTFSNFSFFSQNSGKFARIVFP